VQAAVKRQQRREDGSRHESFAALQLLHDPQGFAEKLFKRLQGGRERFEARIAMLNVVSRAVGVHKLLLLNFYPFLQVRPATAQRGSRLSRRLKTAMQRCCNSHMPVPL
jgi:protein SDA1